MKTLLVSFCLAVAVFATGCTTTTALTWKLPEGVKTVEANGYPLAYLESGSGRTTVAVHGAMCDYRCFERVRAPLSANGRFVSVSVRHSFPEEPDVSISSHSVVQHAKDLAAFIEKMNPPVNLIGHSMGGHIAVEMARARPELVRKLVLVEASTSSLIPGSPMRQNIVRLGQGVEGHLKARNAETGAELAVNSIAGAGTWARTPVPLKAIFKANLLSLVHYGKDQSSTLRCDEFGALKMPVLLVTGQNTSPSFKAVIEEQAKCLPGAQVARVPNAGHSAQSQNPTGFIQAVDAFLR